MPDRVTIGNFVLGLASIALLGALVGVLYGWHVNTAWTRFPGEVIDLVVERKQGGIEMAYPVFHFRDATGTVHTNVSSHGSSPAAYSIGESVTIRQWPRSTSKAVIADFQSLYGIAVICGATGTFGLVLGFTILRLPYWFPRRCPR